jgi:hypothetical protein
MATCSSVPFTVPSIIIVIAAAISLLPHILQYLFHNWIFLSFVNGDRMMQMDAAVQPDVTI